MDPERPEEPAALHEERRARRSGWLGTGSLACPTCDAPTPLFARGASPATLLGCPFCAHRGPLREFLSLSAPHRVPRVDIYIR